MMQNLVAFTVRPCAIKPNNWVKSKLGRVQGSEATKEDALSCFAHCAKYQGAKYFEWVYPNRTGEHAHLAKQCLCKKEDGEFKSCGNKCSISGHLNCGGFYMGKIVKSTRHCRHDDPYKKCDYLWEGGDRVEEEVMDQGFTYDFQQNTSKTEFKCTYMEKDVGIM